MVEKLKIQMVERLLNAMEGALWSDCSPGYECARGGQERLRIRFRLREIQETSQSVATILTGSVREPALKLKTQHVKLNTI